MLAVASGDAYDLWREAENGVRKYEDGAADALLKAYQDANKVYDKYENRRCESNGISDFAAGEGRL